MYRRNITVYYVPHLTDARGTVYTLKKLLFWLIYKIFESFISIVVVLLSENLRAHLQLSV
jgi:hypothetical protein